MGNRLMDVTGSMMYLELFSNNFAEWAEGSNHAFSLRNFVIVTQPFLIADSFYCDVTRTYWKTSSSTCTKRTAVNERRTNRPIYGPNVQDFGRQPIELSILTALATRWIQTRLAVLCFTHKYIVVVLVYMFSQMNLYQMVLLDLQRFIWYVLFFD